MVQWHSISHLARTLKKNSEPAAIWMLVETTNVLNFWKEWKLHTWFFFCPFFVAIQNLHTSACNLHTKATFSVNITFRQPNFVNMHGKPMCMFGNLVFNISIHVNSFFLYNQCNFLVQKQSTCKSLKGKSMQLFHTFAKALKALLCFFKHALKFIF